jgi:predicted XRE-type DNA-binding protein
VLEVVEDDDGTTSRAVYTVKFAVTRVASRSKGIGSRRRKMRKGKDYSLSSGNVFADLGVDASEEALAKAKLTAQISEIIAAMGLTQAAAAKLLGIDQPKVSALLRGRLSGFSTERLIRFLTTLGRDVKIVVRTRPRRRGAAGKIHVVSA